MDIEKQSAYFMGALFAVGGILKIEARNYLETKSQYDSKFRMVCPSLQEESKTMENQFQMGKRKLSEADVDYFESETGFLEVFKFFISAIVKGKSGMIRLEDVDYYQSWTMPEFIDVLDQEKQENGSRLAQFEATHYVLCFLFDLLQFSF